MTTQLSGLAKDIREAVASEQFDLGGYTEPRAKELIANAFSEPLTAPSEMIKFTFVVGGGKLVRSRYSDDLPKWLIAALRDVGYSEDRSAAETLDSQGTFKQQHDTGQNLKYLIVYPKLTLASKPAASTMSAGSKVDTKSPSYIVLASEFSTFQEIINSKVESYAQKKALLAILNEAHEKFQKLEEKLISGQALTSDEQKLYDSNSGFDKEKIAWLQSEIKAMVDGGKLTSAEKTDLLSHIDHNITDLLTEIETAKAENKPRKVEKLQEKLTAMQTRKAHVQTINPIQHRLKYATEIINLRLQLLPLLALEDKGRSMSLQLSDLKALEAKHEIETEIMSLEYQSQGWFENEVDFQVKCENEKKNAIAKYHAKQQGKGSNGSVSGSGGKKTTSTSTGTVKTAVSKGVPSGSGGGTVFTGWSTVAKKPAASSSGTVKKPASSGKSNAFGALADSDDD